VGPYISTETKDGKIAKVQKFKTVKFRYQEMASIHKPPLFSEDTYEKLSKPVIIQNDLNNSLPTEILLKLIRRGSFVKYMANSKPKKQKTVEGQTNELQSDNDEVQIVKKSYEGKVRNVFPSGIELNAKPIDDKVFYPTPVLETIYEIQSDPDILSNFESAAPSQTNSDEFHEFLKENYVKTNLEGDPPIYSGD
jgi:hypothetical protein